MRLLRTPHVALPVDERRAYLYRIAANLANDAWRARRKTGVTEGRAPDELPDACTGRRRPGGRDASHAPPAPSGTDDAVAGLCGAGQSSGDWLGAGLRACERGGWPSDLQAHVTGCAGCREVRAVTIALQGVLAEAIDAPLPDAADIWWRAHWEAGREARQRAMRPLDTFERAEPWLALVAVVTLLVLRGDAIAARVFHWAAGEASGQMLAVLPPALLPVLFVGFALCGLILLFGLSAVLATD